MKHDRTPYTWWCDENEDDDGGSVDDEVDVDDDSDGHHYDSNGVTIRKIFGHLMNGIFWKEKNQRNEEGEKNRKWKPKCKKSESGE